MKDLFLALVHAQPEGHIRFGCWAHETQGGTFPPIRYPTVPRPEPVFRPDLHKGKDQTDKFKEMSEKFKEMSEKFKESKEMSEIRRPGFGGIGPQALASNEVQDFDVSPEQHTFLAVLKEQTEEPEDPVVVLGHREYLRVLAASGQLFTAGAFTSEKRGLMLLVAGTREEAESLVKADPLVQKGYYRSYDLDEVTLV